MFKNFGFLQFLDASLDEDGCNGSRESVCTTSFQVSIVLRLVQGRHQKGVSK